MHKSYKQCDHCDGTGKVDVYVSVMQTPDGTGVLYVDCPRCGGEGSYKSANTNVD